MKSASVKTYMIVFVWLAVITIAEIVIAGFEMPRITLAIFLIGTAIAKSLLIVLYFMHFKYESPWLWTLPAVPVALAVFFVAMLFPDIVYQLTLQY